jgi:hypothetical protein
MMRKLLTLLFALAAFPALAGPITGYPFATEPLNTSDAVIGTQVGVTKQFTTLNLADFSFLNRGLETWTVGVPLTDWTTGLASETTPFAAVDASTSQTNSEPLQCYSATAWTLGAPGTARSCFTAYDLAPAGRLTFDRALTAYLVNQSTSADAAQNTALYARAAKTSTGSTFAGTSELDDWSANPTTSSVTHEFDLDAEGTDTNNARVVVDVWGKSFNAANDTIAKALRFNQDTFALFGDVIQFNLAHRGCTNFINDVATSTFKIDCSGNFTGTTFNATSALEINSVNAGDPLYVSNSAQGNHHQVDGYVALVGGTATITLSGGAVYTSNTSYVCTANDASANASVEVHTTSGTQFTLTGTNTDTIGYQCVGT